MECLDQVLVNGGMDEIYIGLNDLHLSYGKEFMFELLVDGTVEKLTKKISAAGLPYGFGGIARLGQGELPAEKIIMEHYRLGSTRVILSRSFCNTDLIMELSEIDEIFRKNIKNLRKYESEICHITNFNENHEEVKKIIKEIVKKKRSM